MQKEVTKSLANKLDKQALKEVLKFDGADYIKVILKLYDELTKELDKIDKEHSELATSIKSTVESRLTFIKKAWEDLELTKDEKTKIYEDYMDTSKAYQQYLIEKEKETVKEKRKKETVKVISVGGMILSVCCIAVAGAAKIVLTVVKTFK